jgi:hypothetical protein
VRRDDGAVKGEGRCGPPGRASLDGPVREDRVGARGAGCGSLPAACEEVDFRRPRGGLAPVEEQQGWHRVLSPVGEE